MEHRLLSDVDRKLEENPNLSPKFTDDALSLITNPCTSDSSLTSLLETLNLHLQNPNSNSNHQKVLSLLSILSGHHPRLRRRIDAAVIEFILLPSTHTSSLPQALSLLDPDQPETIDLFADESLFLSICFFQCVKTRRWTLKNVSKFRVRPSVLLTVLIGFTKDPYPYIREAALDGLVMLSKGGIVVEDRSLVECCYFRAVELLFDAEITVRRSAVRAVSEWGQLLVALNSDETKRDWSDALFVQLCLMVRDMDMDTRIAAFDALGKIPIVSEEILLLTLSRKAMGAIKEKYYPGQYTAKVFKIPASAAAFTFVHGLEDEFYQVRRSACHALQTLTVLSAKFAAGAVHILMDMLNDDSEVVRLQALVTLQHIAMHDHLTLEPSHLDMFVRALIDSNAFIRSAARKTLQLTKLQKLAMFRSCVDNLMKNLELFPQDEADIFCSLYKIGRVHEKFVTNIIRGVSHELEPSFDGKLSFSKTRTAALLVLAISAPVSFERRICSIPPQIFSYAVTMLGRLSCALVDVMDQDTLLSYLSHCSRLAFSTAENFEGIVLDLRFENNYGLCGMTDEISSFFSESMEPKKVTAPCQSHDKTMNCVVTVLQNVVYLWPLIQVGCIDEVVQMLRSWKEELTIFSRDPCQPAGVLVFALKYLHVLKLLGKVWTCTFSQRNLWFKEMGVLEALFCKMERRLKEMLYRYIGLRKEEELHILELLLVTYTLTLSSGGKRCFEDYMNKLNIVLRRVQYLHKEGSVELSHFVTELQNLSTGFCNSEGGAIHTLDMLQDSLSLFSLKPMVLSGEVKYIDAEIGVSGNDFLNPLPFIPGLPVGIPLDITLDNVSSETILWLAITHGEKSTQFVFLDSHEFGGCNETKKLKFVAPVYRTPHVKHLLLKVSIAMECLSENQHFNYCNGPKHELIHLCEGKEVHLSSSVR